jgi:hypothetical protein
MACWAVPTSVLPKGITLEEFIVDQHVEAEILAALVVSYLACTHCHNQNGE